MNTAQIIIDIFESFLEEKEVNIDNPEKEGDEDNVAIIYGTDYGYLEDRIQEVLDKSEMYNPIYHEYDKNKNT